MITHTQAVLELVQTLVTHASGNLRVLTGMAAEPLAAVAERNLPRLDEALYFQVLAPPPKQPRRVRPPEGAKGSRTRAGTSRSLATDPAVHPSRLPHATAVLSWSRNRTQHRGLRLPPGTLATLDHGSLEKRGPSSLKYRVHSQRNCGAAATAWEAILTPGRNPAATAAPEDA